MSKLKDGLCFFMRGKEWRLVFEKNICIDGELVLGLCDADKKQISITYPCSSWFVDVIHELYEAAAFEYGVNFIPYETSDENTFSRSDRSRYIMTHNQMDNIMRDVAIVLLQIIPQLTKGQKNFILNEGKEMADKMRKTADEAGEA